jgi:hypothetical protein
LQPKEEYTCNTRGGFHARIKAMHAPSLQPR